MVGFTGFIKRFGADESGATAIEYGLIAGTIAVAITTAIWSLGTALRKDVFQYIIDNVNF